MAWSAPMTAVAGSVWTAAQWNTSIRDNLNETEVARAQTVSGYSVVTSLHRLSERSAVVAADTSEVTVDSTSYEDPDTLAGAPTTAGPKLTVFTGQMAFVMIYGAPRSTGGTGSWISFDISGATTQEASDSYAIQNHVTDPDSWRSGATFGVALTEGLNTFTMKYRVSTSGTAHFTSRRLIVVPF